MSWGDAKHVDWLLTEILWEKGVVERLGMSHPWNDRIPWVGARQSSLESALCQIIQGVGK